MTFASLRLVPVALALVSLPPRPAAAQADLDARVAKALVAARPALFRMLAEAQQGELALLCLAAIHDDVPADAAVFQAAIQRLARSNFDRTYELSVRLMVMAELPEFPDRARAAQRDTQRLLACQHAGAFRYNPAGGGTDLSNTQYGALGLRAAQSLGCRVPASSWKGLLAHARRVQSSDGGFVYSGRSSGGTASMTVAGIAIMELCLQYLASSSNVPATSTRQRIERAWDWMARHRSEIGTLRGGWCYYFHYGLERAAVLSDIERVGEKDWYAAGAEMLIASQCADGSWGNTARIKHGDAVSTAFAILFLRRRFQRMPVAVVTPRGTRVLYLPEQATEDDIHDSVALEVARGKDAIPDLLRAMRSAVTAQRKVAALAIHKLAGRDFGYSPYGNDEQQADAIRAAERWWLTEGRSAK